MPLLKTTSKKKWRKDKQRLTKNVKKTPSNPLMKLQNDIHVQKLTQNKKKNGEKTNT